MKRSIRNSMICIAVTFCMLFAMFPFFPEELGGKSGNAYAASAGGTADAMVAFAESCAGKSRSQLGLSGEWCARFVDYCARNSGCSGIVGNNVYVGTLAKQTVNDKGGTITFVNKAAYDACKSRFTSTRVRYDASYRPKKGDLYIQKGEDLGDQYFAHIGIVRSNSSYNYLCYTVEGNTSCDDGKHSNYNNVEYKTRNNNTLSYPYGFSAFVTPNYANAQATHTISYNLRNGSGSFPAVNVKHNDSFTIYNRRPVYAGYTFKGWALRRLSDLKWYVAGVGWKELSEIQNSSSLDLRIYSPDETLQVGSSWTNGGAADADFCFYAQWDPKSYSISYDLNGGSGSFSTIGTGMGQTFSVSGSRPTRSGYTFQGWNLVRNTDGKIYVAGKGWMTSGEISSGNLTAKTYDPGTSLTFGSSMVVDGIDNSNFTFRAVWSGTGKVVIITEPTHLHIYDSAYTVDIEPTCTEPGLESRKCKGCGETKQDSQRLIPATGHSWTEWQVLYEPTETEAGMNSRCCVICGAAETTEIDALDGSSGSSEEQVVSKPKATKISYLTGYRKALKVKWKKKSGVKGYQIQLATNKSFTKGRNTVNINGKSKTSKKVTGLKARKKYYVRIRTYKVANGEMYYSKWSDKKSVKTK